LISEVRSMKYEVRMRRVFLIIFGLELGVEDVEAGDDFNYLDYKVS
jgi:hypothetical protein